MGRPVFPVRLRGIPTRAVFDTGAHLSYIDPRIVAGGQSNGQREDFHPLMGRFTARTYAVSTVLDETPCDIVFGVLPEPLLTMAGMEMAAAGASAVIGTQLLESFDCTISWNRAVISWRRR